MYILRQFLHNNGSLDQLPQHALCQLISCSPRRPSQLWQTRSCSCFFVGVCGRAWEGPDATPRKKTNPVRTAESMRPVDLFPRGRRPAFKTPTQKQRHPASSQEGQRVTELSATSFEERWPRQRLCRSNCKETLPRVRAAGMQRHYHRRGRAT